MVSPCSLSTVTLHERQIFLNNEHIFRETGQKGFCQNVQFVKLNNQESTSSCIYREKASKASYAESALTYTAVVFALSRLARELMLNIKGTANSATMSPILCQSSGVQSEVITGQPPHCCNNSTTGLRPRLSWDSASQQQDGGKVYLENRPILKSGAHF